MGDVQQKGIGFLQTTVHTVVFFHMDHDILY